MPSEIGHADNKPFSEAQSSVGLIASGYEWVCPYCANLNREMQVKETVICHVCSHKYNVFNYCHAID